MAKKKDPVFQVGDFVLYTSPNRVPGFEFNATVVANETGNYMEKDYKNRVRLYITLTGYDWPQWVFAKDCINLTR